ncbi:hypothetical protein NEFER03_1423 [Nematocida sp. LUAm3]|nr:hypothetical protein NEFER03_1423 [Nematocida sp. LUAm3]KAI5174747.1 hypothetical protein NEFER02_0857 [Nematocida sp. LUAm2]KAI5177842.1 hypothetical protein NEFER01_1044 [Nematocida sp. LUAm1]
MKEKLNSAVPHTYIEIYGDTEALPSNKKALLEQWSHIVKTKRIDLLSAQEKALSNSQVITKASIVGVTHQTNPKAVYKHEDTYDIVEVYLDGTEYLDKVSQWRVTSIQMNLVSSCLTIKKGSINRAINSGIYIVIDISPYYSSEKYIWIHNVKEILRLANKRYIVVCCSSPVSPDTVIEIFKEFHVKERVSRRFITDNPQNMLTKASVKKYAYINVIARIQENEPLFKKMIYY